MPFKLIFSGMLIEKRYPVLNQLEPIIDLHIHTQYNALVPGPDE